MAYAPTVSGGGGGAQSADVSAHFKNRSKMGQARNCCGNSMAFALFIIVCVGASGKIPVPTLGWCMASMSPVALMLTFDPRDKNTTTYEKILTVLGSLAIAGVGIAGGLGGLTKTKQLAWGYFGTSLALAALLCPKACADAIKKEMESRMERQMR